MSAAIRHPKLPQALFAAGLAGAGALLLIWLGDLTFWRDEWGFLLERRGFDADVFLEPHYEHIAILHIAAYKALLAGFGMDSALPFQVAATLTFLLSVVLLFVYVNRRVGPWAALAATLPILVLGPAWDDLLWPFQLGFFASMSAGLGALLALERNDLRGDLAACALLVVAATFSSLGVPFVAGAAVYVAWDRDRWRRAYVPLVAAAVYAAWWLGWGHTAPSYVSVHNLATSISYVADGFASSISSLFGLSGRRDENLVTGLDWGRTLLLAAIAVGAWRLVRVGRLGRSLAVVLVIAVVFWTLAGLNASIFREPTSGRYQYMGAIFIVLIAAELWRGARPGRPALLALFAVAVIAAASNLSALRDAHISLVGFGERQPAALAAIELTRDSVDPQFELTEQNSGVDYLGFIRAESYLSAADEYGSPAYTEAELAAASEQARASADQVFAAALELELERGEPTVPILACAIARAQSSGEPATAELPPGGAIVQAPRAGAVEVRVRRYAERHFPVELGRVEAGTSATLAISADRSDKPWQVELRGPGRLKLCGPVD
jgi:hypothetical protein